MNLRKIIYLCSLVLLFGSLQTLEIFAQEKKPVIIQKKAVDEAVAKIPTEDSDKVNKVEDQTTPDKSILATDDHRERYVIGFQDTLEIQVLKHAELSMMVNVSADGTIMMPKIDKPVLAACKTERELRDHLTMLYKSYLKKPFVSVRVTERQSQPIGVIGAVQKPGNFFLNRRITLLELLTLAGGPDVEFEPSKIIVARLGNSAGCGVYLDGTTKAGAETKIEEIPFFEYRMKDVSEGRQNPWMEPGDIVSLPVSEEAYVVGNVVEPKKVSLKETVTLTKAIAMAGGLAKEAKISQVRIKRQGKNGELQTETFYNLKDIDDRKIPDPVLQANDIVDVPNNALKSVRNSIFKALTNGIPSILLRTPL